MLPTNWYSFDELIFVFQETSVKESVQVNKPTDQETVSEQPDNSHLWTEELKKEVQNLEAQSEKHAAKQDIHEGNQNDVRTTNKQETTGGENVNDVTQSDSPEKTKDENSQEFLHVHSSDEHINEGNLKSTEQSGLTETNEQKTETQSKTYQSKDSTHQETKDDGSGSKASQHLEDIEVETETKSQQIKKKKTKLKKGQGKRKTTEHEEMDEWADEDYYDDDDDQPYDEDMDEDLDDDEPLEGSEDSDNFAPGKDYSEEETDSIDSWQMTEKPLDESEDFSDEEDDRKIKEQEVLQEEIKQLKGEYAT